MKLDSEQAWFRAIYQCGGMPAGAVGDIADQYRDQGQKLAFYVNGAVVSIMRAAFVAHQRAEGSPTPADSLLGYRLDEAVRVLPPEWRIVLTAGNGELRVDLYNPFDEPQELPDVDGDPSRATFAAIRMATELAPYTAAPKPPQCFVPVIPY